MEIVAEQENKFGVARVLDLRILLTNKCEEVEEVERRIASGNKNAGIFNRVPKSKQTNLTVSLRNVDVG